MSDSLLTKEYGNFRVFLNQLSDMFENKKVEGKFSFLSKAVLCYVNCVNMC